MHILLLNAGSSSLKAALVDASSGATVARGQGDWAGDGATYRFEIPGDARPATPVTWRGHAAAVTQFVRDLKPFPAPVAVGHRVVHGGSFTESVRITPAVRDRIMQLRNLAPLHNPPSLETLTAAESALPDVPHIAVFDTAFHATIPPVAHTYPIPQAWTRDWGIRRFGFHGLSHAYCARRAAEMLPTGISEPRLVICHLGHGCSAAAVRGGVCVDTTMGFTPLDGLMMATRCGAIDPSIVLHVQQHHGLSIAEVDAALHRRSGLLGVSGISADMREVLAAADGGHEASRLALGIYTHRVRQAVGALAVTLGGIDALVFTAGVGEHAPAIRAAVCGGLSCLGLHLDLRENASRRPDADIAQASSPGRILVIATREEDTMLRDVLGVLNQG